MAWGERAAEQHEKDQPSEPGYHTPANVVYVPICGECGDDVYWNDDENRWEHS